MSSLESVLLVLLTVSGVVTLGGVLVLWWRLDALALRVTRVESHQSSGVSSAEIRRMFEELASMRGQLQTSNQLLQMMQRHLLENDR